MSEGETQGSIRQLTHNGRSFYALASDDRDTSAQEES